eukprot:jgi/Mesen1/2252/ME000153S01480
MAASMAANCIAATLQSSAFLNRSMRSTDHNSLASETTLASLGGQVQFGKCSKSSRRSGRVEASFSQPDRHSQHRIYGDRQQGHATSTIDNSSRQSVAARYAVDDACDLTEKDQEFLDTWRGDVVPSSTVASLERSYVTEAVVGRVECNSKGCRPILDDDADLDLPSDEDWLFRHDASDVLETRTALYHSRTASPEARQEGQFSMDFAQFLDRVWLEKDAAQKYFEAALLRAPHDIKLLTVYAEFTWKELRDIEGAECLYRRAMAEVPDCAEALASYAFFCWQREAC